jgi:SAM-dependent methyltransferase
VPNGQISEWLKKRQVKNQKNNRQSIGFREYQQTRIAHWDSLASEESLYQGWGGYYHQRLRQIYQNIIPPGRQVLELGCAEGDLLSALKPAKGVGVDFSGRMLRQAGNRHPGMRFLQADAHELDLTERFEAIILSDLVNDLWNVQVVLEKAACCSSSRTRLVINSYSRLWEIPLSLAGRLGLARTRLYQNWLTVEDIRNLLALSGWELIRSWEEVLWPLPFPFLGGFCNQFLVKWWPFQYLALTNFFLARPSPTAPSALEPPSVSVIVPARNEAGNLPEIFRRVTEMGRGTELVLVEGHSTDGTYEAMVREAEKYPERSCQLLRQSGSGKGDAVRLGFSRAKGEILMILDADLTVPPEDLPRFYQALVYGKGEMINGVRLVYPLEDQAMRFFNFLGNKFFSLAFSWLLGQPIKDTLCGTKVMWKEDYQHLAANREYFGDFDPFGDFDLLFGSAKLGLKIIDLPIRYRQRVYGTTNIQRWKHGWLLLRMVVFAAGKIKFI